MHHIQIYNLEIALTRVIINYSVLIAKIVSQYF
jgi:hypothetical protein